MIKKTVLLTGGNGYIAQAIRSKLHNIYNISSISRDDLDLRDTYKTQQWFDKKYYDVVIHTAAKGGNRLVEENCSILYDNLTMFTNLKLCTDHYNKFITFGSGAESLSSVSYYGYSKIAINKLMRQYKNFFNLRIYAVFDENENERRFIKSNIHKYITQQNLIVHKNKLMDFIYMPDLLSIIGEYIANDDLPNNIDCVYNTKYSLLNIATMINNLSGHKVNIEVVDKNNDTDYIGHYKNIGLNYIGLEKGISQTYRNINNEKSMVCSK